jgi:iron complex transport system substrate-binding protein
MAYSRRTFVTATCATLLTPRFARAEIVTDDAKRAVTIPANVKRVFPAGLPAAILLYTLAPDLLLGWPHNNRPEVCAYLLPDTCALPEVGRLAGRGRNAKFESVVALKPDLILDVGSTASVYASLADKAHAQIDIPYALLDGGIMSLSTTYEKLGKLIGRGAAGLDFGDYCNMTLGVLTNRIAQVAAEKRPRVYYARGPRGLTTARRGANHVELIELLARNVAGESEGGLTEVTVEQVRTWDPDMIVATDAAFVTGLQGDSAWASVRAVREGHARLAPQMPFGWVDAPPSGNRLIGLWWLAKIFYPALFPEDMRELTRDFFTKFYHVTPTEPRIDYVLAGKN